MCILWLTNLSKICYVTFDVVLKQKFCHFLQKINEIFLMPNSHYFVPIKWLAWSFCTKHTHFIPWLHNKFYRTLCSIMSHTLQANSKKLLQIQCSWLLNQLKSWNERQENIRIQRLWHLCLRKSASLVQIISPLTSRDGQKIKTRQRTTVRKFW